MSVVQRSLTDEDYLVIKRVPEGRYLVAEFYDDSQAKFQWLARGPLAGDEEWFLWTMRSMARFHHLALFNLDLRMMMETSGQIRRMNASELSRFNVPLWEGKVDR